MDRHTRLPRGSAHVDGKATVARVLRVAVERERRKEREWGKKGEIEHDERKRKAEGERGNWLGLPLSKL